MKRADLLLFGVLAAAGYVAWRMISGARAAAQAGEPATGQQPNTNAQTMGSDGTPPSGTMIPTAPDVPFHPLSSAPKWPTSSSVRAPTMATYHPPVTGHWVNTAPPTDDTTSNSSNFN